MYQKTKCSKYVKVPGYQATEVLWVKTLSVLVARCCDFFTFHFFSFLFFLSEQKKKKTKTCCVNQDAQDATEQDLPSCLRYDFIIHGAASTSSFIWKSGEVKQTSLSLPCYQRPLFLHGGGKETIDTHAALKKDKDKDRARLLLSRKA